MREQDLPLAQKILLIALLLVTSGATTVSLAALPVHGQLTGTVCISRTDGPFADSCSPNPSSIGAAPSGTLLIAVNIRSSEGFNGFSISVRTDQRFLVPSGFSIAGTVLNALGPPIVVFSCINGVGTACIVDVDGPGVVSITVRAPLGATTSAPTSGRLFSITYNVTSSPTGSLGAPIFFPGPCLAPFGTSEPGRCIDVFNAVQVPVPETDQIATFR